MAANSMLFPALCILSMWPLPHSISQQMSKTLAGCDGGNEYGKYDLFTSGIKVNWQLKHLWVTREFKSKTVFNKCWVVRMLDACILCYSYKILFVLSWVTTVVLKKTTLYQRIFGNIWRHLVSQLMDRYYWYLVDRCCRCY